MSLTQSNTKPWRVYRFENAEGKYAEVASNEVGPNKIPLPPGYKFVSQRELVFVDALLSDEACEAFGKIVHVASTADIQRAMQAAVDAATGERQS